MSEISIIISGFGGQGVLFAGQLLAYTGMDNGRFVTWIPSYGPEMRGGTANCTVMISDEPIGAPVVAQPDIALVLNQPSFDKYEPLVKQGGLLVVNSSLVVLTTQRTDIDVVYIPANAISEQFGSPKMVNMVAIGGMLAKRPFIPLDLIKQALIDHLPKSKAHLLENNFNVLNHAHQHALSDHAVPQNGAAH